PPPTQLSFDTSPVLSKHALSPRQALTPTAPWLNAHTLLPSSMPCPARGPQAFLLILPELSRHAESPTHAPGCNPPVLPVQASVPIQAPAGGAASGTDSGSRTNSRLSNATTPMRTRLDMRSPFARLWGAETSSGGASEAGEAGCDPYGVISHTPTPPT